MFSKKQIFIYAGEFVVIVVGILIAFQVEEWREGLQQERDLGASLVRLAEETEYNLDLCSRSIPRAIRKANEALTVLKAMQTGRLEPDEVSQFESGLTGLGALFKPPYISTVADEMIATGLLRELENPQLRKVVSGLPRLVNRIHSDFSDQRQALSITLNELARRVEFQYQGSFDFSTSRGDSTGSFEDAISVRYDLEALASDPYFRNLMTEAADTWGDLHDVQNSLCKSTKQVAVLLGESGAH